MRNRLAPLGAIAAGMLLTMLLVASVAAYSGQVAATVQVSTASGPQACGTPITISALIEDLAGAPISGQPVTWTFQSGNLPGDKILNSSSTTNSAGIATTTIQFSCSPHSVRILATADAVSGSVLAITSGQQGLPRTDTAPATSLPMILLAALAVLLGAGMIVRRFATGSR